MYLLIKILGLWFSGPLLLATRFVTSLHLRHPYFCVLAQQIVELAEEA